MKIAPECLPCVMRQIAGFGTRMTEDPVVREKLLMRLLQLTAGMSMDVVPPVIARGQFIEMYSCFGEMDLYLREKDQSTELANTLLDKLKNTIAGMEDKFAATLRLAIGGNILDYGIKDNMRTEEALRDLYGVLDMPLYGSSPEELRKDMEEADSIFYILDNCGEAVMDSLFLEPYRDKVTLGVRGGPVFNDITRRELAASGLDGYNVVDTGDLAPGVLPESSSPKFMSAMRSAPLVIAKGQGNFESLDGYDRPIYFLFRAKCKVVQRYLGGVPENSLQIIRQGF